MKGLLTYLAGPGRSNEHTGQRLVAGSEAALAAAGDRDLTEAVARDVAEALDRPREVFGTVVERTNRKAAHAAMADGTPAGVAVAEATKAEHVWHCSLALRPDEGTLGDDKWRAIAEDFMKEMGFDDPADPRAPARWVAIRHGLSKNGGDHIHIAASAVREDGTKVNTFYFAGGKSRGDFQQAQDVCALLEKRHGLVVTYGDTARITTKGTAPAQEQRRTRVGRAEPARNELARTVRATAAAAESEAEFVRLARAHGLLIRPRYAAGSRDVVTGYSVALSTERYATKNGAPVWHGGGKLGNDLTLPRLRETWIAGDAADADAMSAWAHNHRERIDPSQPAPTPQRARIPQSMTFEEARDRLRDTVAQVAATSRTESLFVGDVFTHPDLLIRPRFAPGSTSEVTGYSVALRPHIYARADGAPQWHGAGKLHEALTLPRLRERWEPTEPSFIREEWARAAGRGEPRVDTWRYAAGDAQKWRDRIEKSPPSNATTWATVSGDTAATVSAWAVRTERGRPAELSRLSDALAATAGQQRSPFVAARRGTSAARRAAAMILAAGQDDPTQAYMVMFAQIAATARAIADAAEARGQAARAVEIRAALDAAHARYAQPAPTQTAQRERSAATAAQPVRTRPGRDTDYGR